jgi:hypothetical protein
MSDNCPQPLGLVTAEPAGRASTSPGAIQNAPNQPASSTAIQREAPQGEQNRIRSKSFWRWPRRAGGVLLLIFLLLLLAALLGLVPNSYSRSTVAGRTVSVVSYHLGASGYAAPGLYRVETGGQRVTVQGDVVDLGNGRLVTIPPWCQEVQITVRAGKASVTFPTP